MLEFSFSLPPTADCTAQDQGNCPAGETAGTETPSGSPCLAAQQMRLQVLANN